MDLFGHLGITLVTVNTVDLRIKRERALLDYRLVLLGSVLPDIIDKAIGRIMFKNYFNSGRIFSHTLLFLLLVLALGVYALRKYRDARLFSLAAGTAMHLILDSMWNFPTILLWPLFGTRFPQFDVGDSWVKSIFSTLIGKPQVYVAEIIGIVILICYVRKLMRNYKLGMFFTSGRIE